jgi:8-oxo-dGTP pyrophosphatase MutT (NUDIX family)
MTAVWESPDLPDRLAADLAAAPADPRWRRELSPELTYGRHAGPARPDARLAAVALVLCWDGLQWAAPLTVRSSTLSRHGGQVSLPGGLVDGDEEAREAAQRELGEELRCRPELIWLGDMAPLFVFASNSLVTPCVAAVREWPPWNPHPPEVQRVLKLSLRDLVEQAPCSPLAVERGLLNFNAPRFIVDGLSVWGATAVLLAELRGRLSRC